MVNHHHSPPFGMVCFYFFLTDCQNRLNDDQGIQQPLNQISDRGKKYNIVVSFEPTGNYVCECRNGHAGLIKFSVFKQFVVSAYFAFVDSGWTYDSFEVS